MKKIFFFLQISLLTTLITSCGWNNKSQTIDLHNSQNSLDWEGTYSNILRAADCPGIYTMIAVDSSKYEVFNKYLERDVTTLSKGDIQWSDSGDSIKIENTMYKVIEGGLVSEYDTLFKVSDDIKIPIQFYTTYMKEDKTGKDASVSIYFKGDNQFADFNYQDKTYNLSLNRKNFQTSQYTDTLVSLTMEIIDPAPKDVTKPFFNDGVKKHLFTIVGPNNYIFITEENNGAPISFDVTYYNDYDFGCVLLLNSNYNECYCLQKIESSAKNSEYSDGIVEWRSGNKNSIFVKDGIEYIYKNSL